MASVATISNISVADRLGEVKAEIARLTEIAKFLSQEIIEAGDATVEGAAYRATVSVVAARKTLDPKAAEAKLRSMGVDGRWFVKNTKTVSGFSSVRVTAIKA